MPLSNFENFAPKHILLIEDNPVMADLVTTLLEHRKEPQRFQKTRVQNATTLAEAQKCLVSDQETPYDLILLDLRLPDSSGLATLKTIRALRDDLPIVVLTGTAQDTSGVEALTAGAQDFIVKDDHLQTLLYRICTYAVCRFAQETLIKKAMQEAEETNKIKDRFVALVAHDLRGPLSAILGLTELLVSDDQSTTLAQHRDEIDCIKKSALDLTELLTDILDISKLNTGKITPAKSFFDIHNLVNDVIKRLRLMADNKQLKLNNRIPEGSRFYADEKLLIQVLQNLLSNAIKFSFPGKSIDFFLRPGHPTHLAIRDEGVGIAPEAMTRLLKIEEKTSTLGTKGESGTGFGLPLSAGIIEAHGGELLIESTPGCGSTFMVCIPPVRPLVLIVDDQYISRQILVTQLEPLDVDIMEAGSGKDALKLIEDKTPDLALIDVFMPDMNGLELLEIMMDNPRFAEIPTIMVTADQSMETRQKAIRLGASDFTLKPIEPLELIPRIQRFIV
ncbi:MAG: hybrid sensor histidine kinase/response regulator [Methylococcaceae bacterium]|nr:MAG: hybrid sensor histidine kinase/response regulator [Methylococcaceae bacterium]